MKKLHLLSLFLLLGILKGYSQDPNVVTYNFKDGTIISAKQSSDGKLTLGGDYIHHGTTYGLDLKLDQEINISVDQNSIVRFLGSKYSGLHMVGTDTATGNILGEQNTQVANDLEDTYEFVYSGPATILNFKTVAGTGNDVYLPSLEVIKTALPETSNGLADVWDFGASQLDDSKFNNKLTEDIINSFYPESVTPGSGGNLFPNFSVGDLTWVGGGNDRLRTSNTNLTRYDENISEYEDFKGRLYINASGASSRFISLELNENDEVTLWGLTQNGNGNIHFERILLPK